MLNAVARSIPWLVGGSADLAPSTKTRLTFEGAGDFEAGSYGGRNFHFGIREHAMGAVLNGLTLSKVRPYGAGFLIFSDYGRPAIRLAALMEIPVIYVFTHDSIGVGEDGPTHQPIEQLAALRAIPGLVTIRPGDANEVAEAWRVILGLRHQPAALVLTRQALPTLDRTRYAPASGLARGGYVLADAPGGDARGPAPRHGQRGLALPLRPRAARGRRHPEPRRQHALVGAVRRPAGRIQGRRAAAVGDGQGRRRAGVDPRLGAVRRVPGPGDRHEDVRRLRSPQGAAEEVRLRAGPGGGGGPRGRREVGMRVVVGADHAGFALKQEIAEDLRHRGHEVLDVGTDSTEPVDYPDSAEAVGRAVTDGRAERGVLVCGSGVGASVAANKLPGVRAAVCHDAYSAHQGVEHDDMNVLVLGGRIIGSALAHELVEAYLAARFSGAERHVRRLEKVKALEARYVSSRRQ